MLKEVIFIIIEVLNLTLNSKCVANLSYVQILSEKEPKFVKHVFHEVEFHDMFIIFTIEIHNSIRPNGSNFVKMNVSLP